MVAILCTCFFSMCISFLALSIDNIFAYFSNVVYLFLTDL